MSPLHRRPSKLLWLLAVLPLLKPSKRLSVVVLILPLCSQRQLQVAVMVVRKLLVKTVAPVAPLSVVRKDLPTAVAAVLA